MAGRHLQPELEAELVEVAGLLADVAGMAAVRLFRSSQLTAENKADEGWDPVTEADRQSELAMRRVLAARRPTDGVHGEEFEPVTGSSGLTWVLDPIDGTRAFVSGIPVWGVLISVSDMNGPLYGVIDQPYIGERFEGGFGRAVMRGPYGRRSLSTRATHQIENAVLCTTFPEIGTDAEKRTFQSLSGQVLLTRYGLDCYSYGLLALGQIDLVVEAGMKPFDVHAPIAVVQAAGGIATDWAGGACHDGGRIIAAATEELHATAVGILAEGLA
ncbi:MAG: inositol monophosphatase family protein [Rhodobacteraceae bacterium]|nr:inositol monophosphatase family protein [Paracoccaceae bacterium]